MMIGRILHLIYAGIILFTIAITYTTEDFHNLILGAIVLVIMYESSTFLLTYYDNILSVPDSEVFGTTGDVIYRLIMSEFIFGTYPFYIYSGGQRIAKLYRNSDVLISVSADDPVAITRESTYQNVKEFVTLSRDSINYISVQGESSKVIVDYYKEESEIDRKKYSIEYEYLKSQFISMDKGGLSIAITSIMALMAIYFKI